MNKKNDFNSLIAQIKEETLDVETTKEYIELIQKYTQKMIDSYADERTKHEILQDFLEDFDGTLFTKSLGKEICSETIKYKTCEELLSAYKGNKNIFANYKRLAKQSGIYSNLPIDDERKISLIRSILSKNTNIKEKDMVELIKREENISSKKAKDMLIATIQNSVSFLNEYGIIDRNIEESNSMLEELDLTELKLKKRNPIPDEYASSESNIEDIGVLDSFEKEELEKISLKDLLFLASFWESQYMVNRMEISKALAVMESLNMFENNENISNSRIEAALKQDIILTHLIKNREEISRKMKKQYRKYTEENGLKAHELEEDVDNAEVKKTDLNFTTNDILNYQYLIIQMLIKKQLKVKNWGKIENVENISDFDIAIGIESGNFRGPLIMAIPKQILLQAFKIKDDEIPTYKGYLNQAYSEVMARVLLVSNNYFKKQVKEKYKQNKSSELYASLAGKKPGSGSNEER